MSESRRGCGPHLISRVVGLVTAVGLLSTAAMAADPPQTPWTYNPALPPGAQLMSAAFSPDGTTCYIHVLAPSIEAWGIAVHFWPEAGAVVLAPALLVCGLIIFRRSRRRQTSGLPYCRVCNYDLSSIAHARPADGGKGFDTAPDARCPECGAMLDRIPPRSGRTLRYRIVPHVAVCVIVAGLYGGLVAMHVPRNGRASQWFDFSSTRLADYASTRSIPWLKAWARQSDQIIEFDLRTGTTVRRLATRRSSSFTNIKVSPDGKLLFLSDSGGAGEFVTAISTSSGRRVRGLASKERGPLFIHVDSVIGFSADGRTAYVAWAHNNTKTCGVTAWNLDSGEETILVQTPAYVDARPGGGGVWAPSFAPLGGKTLRFISWPNFMEAFPTKTYKIRIHEPHADVVEFDLKTEPNPSSRPAMSPDGSKIYLPDHYGGGLLSASLPDGTPAEPIKTPGHVWDTLTMSSDGSLLLVPCMSGDGSSRGGESVLIRDTKQNRWIARLNVPAGLIAPRSVISNDRRWVAAVLQASARSGVSPSSSPGTHQLVLWNIAPLLSDAAAPATPDR